MQGLVVRLNQHYHECAAVIKYTNELYADLDISQTDIQPVSQKRISDIYSAPNAKKKSSTMTNLIIQTSKAAIDLRIA